MLFCLINKWNKYGDEDSSWFMSGFYFHDSRSGSICRLHLHCTLRRKFILKCIFTTIIIIIELQQLSTYKDIMIILKCILVKNRFKVYIIYNKPLVNNLPWTCCSVLKIFNLNGISRPLVRWNLGKMGDVSNSLAGRVLVFFCRAWLAASWCWTRYGPVLLWVISLAGERTHTY